jgi:hypothetical protein
MHKLRVARAIATQSWLTIVLFAQSWLTLVFLAQSWLTIVFFARVRRTVVARGFVVVDVGQAPSSYARP